MYGFGLARINGNGIAFLALVTFLGINDYESDADERAVVAKTVMLGDARLSDRQLADWSSISGVHLYRVEAGLQPRLRPT